MPVLIARPVVTKLFFSMAQPGKHGPAVDRGDWGILVSAQYPEVICRRTSNSTWTAMHSLS